MNWFEKLMPSKIRTSGANDKKNVPEGLWAKCNNCDANLRGRNLIKGGKNSQQVVA